MRRSKPISTSFKTMPTEIRIQIYGYVLDAGQPLGFGTAYQPWYMCPTEHPVKSLEEYQSRQSLLAIDIKGLNVAEEATEVLLRVNVFRVPLFMLTAFMDRHWMMFTANTKSLQTMDHLTRLQLNSEHHEIQKQRVLARKLDVLARCPGLKTVEFRLKQERYSPTNWGDVRKWYQISYVTVQESAGSIKSLATCSLSSEDGLESYGEAEQRFSDFVIEDPRVLHILSGSWERLRFLAKVFMSLGIGWIESVAGEIRSKDVTVRFDKKFTEGKWSWRMTDIETKF